MRHPFRPRPRGPLAWLIGLAALLGASPGVSANETSFLYTLTETGRVTLQVTPVETLPTLNGRFRFSDLAAGNGNRWALTVDGRVFRNGDHLLSLPFPSDVTAESGDDGFAWIRLLLDPEELLPPGDGVGIQSERVLALSAGGLVVLDGDTIAELPVAVTVDDDGTTPPTPLLFVDIVITDFGVFALRLDGALFDVERGTLVGVFDGGPSVDGADNGAADHAFWSRIVRDPNTGTLFALRADGVILAVDPEQLPLEPDEDGQVPRLGVDLGSEVARLPGTAFDLIVRRNLYVDLEISAGSNWNALRRNGGVFAQGSQQVPFLPSVGGANFVGNPNTTPLLGADRTGNPFMDMVLLDGVVWRVRSLGQLYFQETLVDQLLSFDFVRMAGDGSAPNLAGVLNKPPSLSVYKSRVVEGEELIVPIIPMDVDQPLSELDIAFSFKGLPGGSFDADAGVVRGPAGLAPGRYSFICTIDDGGPQRNLRKKYKLRVLEANTKGRKNRAPVPTKMSRSIALVGTELVLPILATDREGDDITIEPDGKGVFQRGATFDPKTNTLHWTPDCIDSGRNQAGFRITDGTKTSRLKIKIVVLFPLFREVVTPPDG